MFESLLPALFSFFITYMLCLFFSGSARFSLILAIFFAVTNYIQKLKLKLDDIHNFALPEEGQKRALVVIS